MKKIYILFALCLLVLLAGCNGKEEIKPMPIPSIEDIESETTEDSVGLPDKEENKETDVNKGEVVISETEPKKEIDEQAFTKAIERVKSLNYKEMATAALTRSQKLASDDRNLRKWIIRLHIYNTIRGENVKDDVILKNAKEALNRRNSWFTYVDKEYKVTVSKSEIDAYIKKVAKNSKETEQIAVALGMSLEDLNYEYERDQYQQQLMWTKLIPKLQKKYPKKEKESNEDYNERLNLEFNKELDSFIKK